MPLSTENIIYDQRKLLFTDEKRRIAELAARHIPDGASLCINIGTTTEAVAFALLDHKNLRILTNNLNVARICAGNETFEVIIAGGTVRSHDLGVIGPETEQFIQEFRMDFGIIGISGIDGEGNLLDVRLSGSFGGARHHCAFAAGVSRVRQIQVRASGHGAGRTCEPARSRVFRRAPALRWQSLIRDSGAHLYLA